MEWASSVPHVHRGPGERLWILCFQKSPKNDKTTRRDLNRSDWPSYTHWGKSDHDQATPKSAFFKLNKHELQSFHCLSMHFDNCLTLLCIALGGIHRRKKRLGKFVEWQSEFPEMARSQESVDLCSQNGRRAEFHVKHGIPASKGFALLHACLGQQGNWHAQQIPICSTQARKNTCMCRKNVSHVGLTYRWCCQTTGTGASMYVFLSGKDIHSVQTFLRATWFWWKFRSCKMTSETQNNLSGHRGRVLAELSWWLRSGVTSGTKTGRTVVFLRGTCISLTTNSLALFAGVRQPKVFNFFVSAMLRRNGNQRVYSRSKTTVDSWAQLKLCLWFRKQLQVQSHLYSHWMSSFIMCAWCFVLFTFHSTNYQGRNLSELWKKVQGSWSEKFVMYVHVLSSSGLPAPSVYIHSSGWFSSPDSNISRSCIVLKRIKRVTCKAVDVQKLSSLDLGCRNANQVTMIPAQATNDFR